MKVQNKAIVVTGGRNGIGRELVLRLLTEDILAHPLSLRRILAKGRRHLPKFRGTVADELKRLFSDDSVRAAMAGVLLYTGLPPERQPAIGVLGLVTLFSDGFHLPAGGMGSVSAALSRALLAHGGEIHAKLEELSSLAGQLRDGLKNLEGKQGACDEP